jgi:hypothetical protein
MKAWGLIVVPLLSAAPVLGQTVEVTPMAGYRFGGGFSWAADAPDDPAGRLEVAEAASFGAHVTVSVSEDGELEAIYSRQNTRLQTSDLFAGQEVFDLDLETWLFGGNFLWGDRDARVRPYIGMGLGITRLLPGPADLQDETRFAASLAGGVKVWLGRHLGLRLEARGIFTILESESDVFCGGGEGCLVRAEGADISQGQVGGGLVLRF